MHNVRPRKYNYMPIIISFLITVGLIIFVFCVIPLIDGYLYKKEYLRVMTMLAEKYSDKSTKIEIVEYNLGWFHSTAKLRVISTDPAAQQYMSDGFTVVDDITHGPYVYNPMTDSHTFAFANVVSRTHLPRLLQALVMPTLRDSPIVEVNILASFNNTWTSKIKVAPLAVPYVGKMVFGDSIATLTFDVQDNMISAYTIKTEMGGLSFTTGNPYLPSIYIRSALATANSTKNANGVWNSSNTLSVPSIALSWADSSALTINTLDTNSQYNIDANNLFQFSGGITVKNISYPTFFISNISDLKENLSIKNVNYTGLLEYGSSGGDPAAMIQNVNKVFTPNSAIDAALSFNSNLGALTSSANFSLKPGTDLNNLQIDGLMAAVQSNANAKIAAPLLKQLVIKYLEKQDKDMQPLPATPAPTHTPTDPLEDAVGTLYREGKITLNQSLDIIGASDQKLAEDAFAQKMAEISPDNAQVLVAAYHAKLTQAAQPLPAKPSVVNRDQRADQMIADLLQQGYLVQEGNDYSIKASLVDGVLTINGKVFDHPATSPVTPAATAPQVAPAAPVAEPVAPPQPEPAP